jgi:AcrR family transcriptional regulator
MDEMDPAADARLIEALFRVIARQGWRGVTAPRLAAESGLPARELVRRFPSRLGLLRLWGDLVAAEVERGTVPGQGGTPRDRLFDVLMRGLDALGPNKAGVTRLMRDMYADGLLAGALAPVFARCMPRFLAAAGLDSTGPKGALRAAGLGVIWMRAVHAWSKDPSEDLGATMAALDRALDRAEKTARSLGLADGDMAPPPASA